VDYGPRGPNPPYENLYENLNVGWISVLA
jgi:hypothetical protein